MRRARLKSTEVSKMATILERYHEKFRKSGEAFERGKSVIPGGGHQSREAKPFPLFVEEGKGALKWDVDGNELVDYRIGFGALLLGHSEPRVTEAVAARLNKGTHMGTLSELEIEWAELVTGLIPSVELVRFTPCGSPAATRARPRRSSSESTSTVGTTTFRWIRESTPKWGSRRRRCRRWSSSNQRSKP